MVHSVLVEIDEKEEEKKIEEEELSELLELSSWDTPLMSTKIDVQGKKKSSVVEHEGRHFRNGNICVLVVDAVGPRASHQSSPTTTSSTNTNAIDPIGEKQFDEITNYLNMTQGVVTTTTTSNALNATDATTATVEPPTILMVVLHTPITGRQPTDTSSGSSEASVRDIFGDVMGQQSLCRLLDLLFKWMSNNGNNSTNNGNKRIVRIVSGDNGVGAACTSLLKDRLNSNTTISWTSVGPMSSKVIGTPPFDDPRSQEWQSKHGTHKRTTLTTGSSSQVTYPMTLQGRTLPQQQQQYNEALWYPEMIVTEEPLWKRRNYAVFRLFQGNLSPLPGVSVSDGDSTTSSWHVPADSIRIDTYLIPTTDASNPNITMGPVIGTVTSTSAVIMIEIEKDAVVTCEVMDVLTGNTRVANLCTNIATTVSASSSSSIGTDSSTNKTMLGNRPHVFHAQYLASGRKYSVLFKGVSNGSTRRGSFVTLQSQLRKVTVVDEAMNQNNTNNNSNTNNTNNTNNQGENRQNRQNRQNGQNGQEHNTETQTAQQIKSHVRLLVASTDHPHLLTHVGVAGHELTSTGIASHHRDVVLPPRTTWESIWRDQLQGRWKGCDLMLRLGGQVWLRGKIETQLSSILESHRGHVFEHLIELMYQVRQTSVMSLGSDSQKKTKTTEEVILGDHVDGIVSLERGPTWSSMNMSVGAIPASYTQGADFESEEDGKSKSDTGAM